MLALTLPQNYKLVIFVTEYLYPNLIVHLDQQLKMEQLEFIVKSQ